MNKQKPCKGNAPKGKICNPLTGRHIEKSGSIGKLLTAYKFGNKPCDYKAVPTGKICNPLTGRYVSITSQTGKYLKASMLKYGIRVKTPSPGYYPSSVEMVKAKLRQNKKKLNRLVVSPQRGKKGAKSMSVSKVSTINVLNRLFKRSKLKHPSLSLSQLKRQLKNSKKRLNRKFPKKEKKSWANQMNELDKSPPKSDVVKIYEKLLGTTKFVGPQPANIMKITDFENVVNWMATLKYDGERMLMLTGYGPHPFAFSRNMRKITELTEMKNTKTYGICLLDTEFYRNTYHVFDCYVFKNKSLLSLNKTGERLAKANAVVSSFNSKKVVMKPFVSIKDVIMKGFNIYQVLKDKSKGIKDDGLIFQGPDDKAYKWKPSNLITIDFLVKPNDRSLYVRTGLTMTPFQIGKKTARYEGPYLGKGIYEFKYEDWGVFKLLRARPDKETPNAMKTARSTMTSILNPVDMKFLIYSVWKDVMKKMNPENAFTFGQKMKNIEIEARMGTVNQQVFDKIVNMFKGKGVTYRTRNVFTNKGIRTTYNNRGKKLQSIRKFQLFEFPLGNTSKGKITIEHIEREAKGKPIKERKKQRTSITFGNTKIELTKVNNATNYELEVEALPGASFKQFMEIYTLMNKLSK